MVGVEEGTDSPLAPYRALDLTEGGFNWCGKVLADLGADVIKIEPPGGSPTRRQGPFYKDEVHPERSLFWYAYCLNKRGVTLNLESRDGQDLFRKLVATADFVLESFPPDYMDSLGLGYETLCRVNPGVVMTSITPFGRTGPYAHYKATDIVAWSMGGMQYVSGEEDRPPVRVSFPQAELQAGAQAAAGSMTAFWHRQNTGEGQHVDVSMQVAVIWTLMNATSYPQLHKTNLERGGAYRTVGKLERRLLYPCKDGYVVAMIRAGAQGESSLSAICHWMDAEGVLPELMQDRDWVGWDLASLTEENIEDLRAVERHVSEFFLTKTKAELYDRAIVDGILLAPCNTARDIWESPQLAARDFWPAIYHPELNAALTYLGPYIRFSETPIRVRRRAPLIGEDNEEVYVNELGLAKERVRQLKTLGVV